MAKSIGIIGAGITGLTLGRFLFERGMDFELYERSSDVGGVMQSHRQDDWLAEAGPNSFLVKSPEVESLLQQTNIVSERIFASDQVQKRYVVRGGSLHPVPTGALSLLKTRLFSARAKLRLLKEPFVGPAPADRDESVASFVRRRLGPEFLDYAIDPFVAGVFAGDPEQLSIRHAFPRMHALEQEYGSLIAGLLRGRRRRKERDRDLPDDNRIFSFPDGLGQLPDLLAEPLSDGLRCGTKVRQIQKARNGTWRVTVDQNHETTSRRHSAVVCTVPLHRLSEIEFGIDAADRLQTLSEVYYPPVSVWTLGFHRSQVDHSLDGFGMLMPGKERSGVLGTLFPSTLFPGRAPENHVTLTSFLGGARQPDIPRKPDDEQKTLLLRELRELLDIGGDPAFETVFHWPHAIPQYEVEYGRVKQAFQQLEQTNEGLHFAGNFREGPSIDNCMKCAIQLGKTLAES